MDSNTQEPTVSRKLDILRQAGELISNGHNFRIQGMMIDVYDSGNPRMVTCLVWRRNYDQRPGFIALGLIHMLGIK